MQPFPRTKWVALLVASVAMLHPTRAATTVRTVELSNCIVDDDDESTSGSSSSSSSSSSSGRSDVFSRAFWFGDDNSDAATTTTTPSRTKCDIDWNDIQDLGVDPMAEDDANDDDDVIRFNLLDVDGEAQFEHDRLDAENTITIMHEATRNRRKLALDDGDDDNSQFAYGWTGTNQQAGGDANVIVQDRTDGTQAIFGSFTDIATQKLCQFSVDGEGNNVAKCLDLTQDDLEDEIDDDDDDDESGRALRFEEEIHEFEMNEDEDDEFDEEQFATDIEISPRSLAYNVHSSSYITKLDVMVIWTRRAECQNSGHLNLDQCTLTSTTRANMLGLIDLAIFESNVAFEESGVYARFNLVHAYRDETYVEREQSMDNIRGLLTNLQRKKDPYLKDAHAKRQEYGADMVFLFAGRGRSCGAASKGPFLDDMFAVVRYACVAGRFTLAHEAGHLLGCKHDRGTHSECKDFKRKRNYGYRDPSAAFRTIMAYDCKHAGSECDGVVQGNCPRIQRFASDNIQYNGKQIGDRGAACAGLLNKMKDRAAAFFPTTCRMGQKELNLEIVGETRRTTGQVFEIEAKQSTIYITSLSIQSRARSELATMEIWSLEGSYDRSNIAQGAWKRIHSQTVMEVGRVGLTRIDCLDEFVTIERRQTHSFYVTFTDRADLLFAEGTQEGDKARSDSNMRLLQGKGVGGYPFKDVSSTPQMFIGAVQYIVKDSYYRQRRSLSSPQSAPRPSIWPPVNQTTHGIDTDHRISSSENSIGAKEAKHSALRRPYNI